MMMYNPDPIRLRPALALLTMLGMLAFASPALAQSADELQLEDVPTVEDETSSEDAAETSAEERAEPVRRAAPTAEQRREQASESTYRQLQTDANTVHIYQLAEEMVDEALSDMADLNPAAISPMAVRNLNLTPNLSMHFGSFVESTLISGVANLLPEHRIKRCIACRAMRSRVEGDEWVVSVGLTEHEDLQREADRLGVKTFLDINFAFFPGANIVAMQLEVFRTDDASIIWSETYRSDATSAAILRTGDRIQSRAERVRELERKIEERPYYGHILYLGMSTIPYDGPAGAITGAAIGYRLYERFGEDRRFLFGIGAEGFANFSDANGLLGAFVGATFQRELLAPNLNQLKLRTGPTVGGFFAGSEGNSLAVEWGLDAVLQFRMGAGLSLMYFLPTEYAGYDLGGFGFKARASFNW